MKYPLFIAALLLVGCADDLEDPPWLGHYATEIVALEIGESAGFGAELLPGVVLGPPEGHGTSRGGLDVLSLGVGGSITLRFDPPIADGPGDDFIVFENAFWASDDSAQVFAELGEVSVSADGENWLTYPCDATAMTPPFDGCAGWNPTMSFDRETVPLNPTETGGDAFDLSTLGSDEVSFVRIRDLETQEPLGNSAGFDLDAIGVIRR